MDWDGQKQKSLGVICFLVTGFRLLETKYSRTREYVVLCVSFAMHILLYALLGYYPNTGKTICQVPTRKGTIILFYNYIFKIFLI